MQHTIAKRNETLDLCKLFAAYMVIFIHVLFYRKIGIVFDALARFAVPLYFVSSGYFSYGNSPEKIKSKTFHILKILIFAVVIYNVYNIIMFCINGDTSAIVEYITNFFNIKKLIMLVVFNVPISSAHIWFLFALLYVYIIQYFICKFHISEKLVFAVSFVCLFLHLFLGEMLSAFGIVMPIYTVRNFLLMGFPFFNIGIMIRKHNDKFKNINNSVIIISGLVGMAATLLSRKMFGKNELYIGSLFILFAIVTISIKYCGKRYNKWVVLLASCSTNIYIFHILVKNVIYKLVVLLNIQTASPLFQMVWPILVCILTTLLAVSIHYIQKKFAFLKRSTQANSIVK